MNTLSDIRKAIKPLGFKLKTTSMIWGRAATYIHTETGEELNYNVFDETTFNRWKPLLDWRTENREALKAVRAAENCTGLL